MNPPPLFSVIIPTYNRAAKLVRAVESVLQQTCQDFDLWVIDDGSTDDTQEVLKPFAGRLHYLLQANQGTCVARNTGIQNSNGRYVAFLDSDDHWLPGRLAAVANAARAHPEVGVFYSSVTNVDEDGRILWQVHAREVRGSAYIEMLKADFMVLSSVVVKRACLQKTGIFDPMLKMSEDWDLLIRLARHFPIYAIPETLVIFEYGSPDKKTRNYQRWIEGHDAILEKAFQADPELTAAQKRKILSSISYVKGRICIEARADDDAKSWFRKSLSLNGLRWKSAVYLLVLYMPVIRRILPVRIKTVLRLPEISG